MNRSYRDILRQEINDRYNSSSKIYRFISVIHFMKLFFLSSYIITYIDYDCNTPYLTWAIGCIFLIILMNIRCRLSFNRSSSMVYKLYYTIVILLYIFWLYKGFTIYFNEKTCVLRDYVLAYLIFDIATDIIFILNFVCIYCLLYFNICTRSVRFYSILNFISSEPNIQQVDISNMSEIIYSNDLYQDTSQTQCPICLIDFEEGNILDGFTCKHIFHKECINNWLLLKNTCPMCRQPIIDGNQLNEPLIQN